MFIYKNVGIFKASYINFLNRYAFTALLECLNPPPHENLQRPLGGKAVSSPLGTYDLNIPEIKMLNLTYIYLNSYITRKNNKHQFHRMKVRIRSVCST